MTQVAAQRLRYLMSLKYRKAGTKTAQHQTKPFDMTSLTTLHAKTAAAILTLAMTALTSGCGGGGGSETGTSDPGSTATTASASQRNELPIAAPLSSSEAATAALPAVVFVPTIAAPSAATPAAVSPVPTLLSPTADLPPIAAPVAAPVVVPGVVPVVAPVVVPVVAPVAAPAATPVAAPVVAPLVIPPVAPQTAAPAATSTGSISVATALADWAPVAKPAASGVPEKVSQRLPLADVIAYISAGNLYPVRNIGLQCQGANASLADVPGTTQAVDTSTGLRATRFGLAGSVNPVFRLELGAADLLPAASSPRCELMPYPMPGSSLPVGAPFWLSYSLWIDDWDGSTDEMIIGQMHIQDPRNILLNPFLGLVVQGREMRVELRHNPLPTPSQASTTLLTAARVTLPTRRWFNLSIRAKIGETPAQPGFFQMWLDDVKVADYAGPWGYALGPNAAAYAKVGLYHWLNGNPWDTRRPTRSMMLGALLLARDSNPARSRQDLADAVAVALP